jgi:4-oxalocrotonate tautomerase
MPHLIVKLWSGESEARKQTLADEIAKDGMAVLRYGEESVSVAIEEIEPHEWTKAVYEPDIEARWETLYKKPGYRPIR